MKNMFKSGMEIFPEKLQIIFNLALVIEKARDAMLIEMNDHEPEFYQTFKDWLDDQIKNCGGCLEYIEIIRNEVPDILIFNKNISSNSLDKYLNTSSSKYMGEVLGYQCAGQLGENWVLNYYIDGEQFYAESCKNEPDKNIINEQFKKFKSVADKLGLNVQMVVERHISVEEAIEVVKTENIKTVYENKDNIANYLENIGFNQTSKKLSNENYDEFKLFFEKFKEILLFQLLLYKYDPVEQFYPLTKIQNEINDKNYENLESQLFG